MYPPSSVWALWVLLLLLVDPGPCAGQGLPLPGKPGLSARDYSRVRAWATEGQAWRSSYAADPGAACNAVSGLCAASPGSEDYGKLLVATSPADYDARTASVSFVPIGPVQDQRPCQSGVAFAVISAAEAAVSSALHVDASNISLSQQDLQFCPDAQRSCQEPWDVKAAVDRLMNGSIVAYDCLPYTAATSDDPAKMCNYRCKDQPKLLQGGRFRAASVRSPLEGQRQIRRYGSFVTRFNVYQDFLTWVRDVAPSDPTAVYECPNSGQPPSEGHAVSVVGYNNTEGYWLVKNSWGTGNGDKGFFRVRYGVCGMLAPGDTVGVSFIPAQPVALNVTGPVADPQPGNKSRTCYNYTAQPGDYLSKVADAAVIRVGQLLQDNNASVKDLDKPLAGTQLLLCDPDPSSVSTGATRKPAAGTGNATAANGTTTNSTGVNATTAPAASALLPSRAPVSAAGAVLPELPASPPPRARPAVVTPAEEAAALLALKDALGYKNPEWQGDEPCLSTKPWPGLYCNSEGRVYMIDLSSQLLSGTLGDSTDLSKLPFLQALWLYDNPSLSGSLPPSWSKSDRLREVSLYGTSITGPLPPSWGQLKRLRHLYLHNNKLTGSLPEEWGALGALSHLGLGTNELSGTIPSSWTGMRSLKSISLYENAGLVGCLPPNWLKGTSSRSQQEPVKLTKPADNIRPLAGTKLCRTCSDTCRAAGAAGAMLPPASSGSSDGGSSKARVVPPLMPPKDPGGAAEGLGARIAPPLNPGAADGATKQPPAVPVPPVVAGGLPAAGAGAVGPQGVLPGAVNPSAQGPAAAAANATAGKPPAAAAAGLVPPGANTTGGTAAAGGALLPPSTPKPLERAAITPVQPAGGAVLKPAVAAPQPVTPAAAAGSGPADPTTPPSAAAAGPATAAKLDVAGGAGGGGAAAGGGSNAASTPPAAAAVPAATPAAPAITAPGAPTTAAPPPPAAVPAPPPTPPPPSPPLPAPASPPAGPMPNPIGSLPVPVDPALTVISNSNRRPNFQDVTASGRRRLVLQLQGA